MTTEKYDIVKELEDEGSNLSWEAAETIRILRRAIEAQIRLTNSIRDKYENRRD